VLSNCLPFCFRTSYLCSMTFSVGLNEPGSIAWALPMAANTSMLPTPQQLLGAVDPSQFFLPGSTPKGSAQVPAAAALPNATVVSLASQTAYTLVLSARDAAPALNYIPSLVTVQLTAPDVRPPAFTGGAKQAAQGFTLHAHHCNHALGHALQLIKHLHGVCCVSGQAVSSCWEGAV
jgi:hypothetical protein